MSWQNTHRLEALLGTVALFSPVSHGRDEDEEEGDEDEVQKEEDEHLPPPPGGERPNSKTVLSD